MKITIVGGGNIGTQFAVHSACKGHEVTIFTSKPSLFSKELSIVNRDGITLHKSAISLVTNNPAVAFKDVELIFVTVPSFLFNEIASQIEPYVKEQLIICTVPGSGGSEFAFSKCMKKGAVLCGLQRVPSVARLVKYGHSVCATGYRNLLYLAALPKKHEKKCCSIVESIFDIKCNNLPCYLNLTLNNSNPILHTSRIYSLLKNYKTGDSFDNIAFYEEWDDSASKLLIECDEELHKIFKYLPFFDLSGVSSIKAHYESNTIEDLTKKIRSISSFKGIYFPMKTNSDNRYVPDFSSRYFKSDFSFGLSIFVQLSELLNIQTPCMTSIWNWYKKISLDQDFFKFSNYGIYCSRDFFNFYRELERPS